MRRCIHSSVTKGAHTPTSLATAQPARDKEIGLHQIKRITEAARKNLFQFSFVCLRRCH
jgi:hypothetical protein